MDGSTRPPSRRNFLFLQGMATRFFARLGTELTARGHGVRRINFNGGDRLFWPLRGAMDYRGDHAQWPAFLERRLAEWGITDIILFGDCRPLHQAALAVAARHFIPVHVFEEGYLRPNWITLEQGGANGNSGLGRDPQWFRDNAAATPAWDGGTMVRSNYSRRAAEDVAYNFAKFLLSWRFPGYETHRPQPAWAEYLGGGRRFLRKPLVKRQRRAIIGEILASERRYYVFPLQVESDYQIRCHSPFGRIAPMIEQVIDSFARHAPRETWLVITEHPLDTSFTDWHDVVRRRAAETGIGDRVRFIAGGSPDRLIKHCGGVVTVNSTVGYLGLYFGRPVMALGTAIYDMPELTFQGALDRFWTDGKPPHAATFDAFRRVVAARCQVNGGFFSREGLALALKGAADRLENTAGAWAFDRVSVLSARPERYALAWLPAAAQSD